MANDMTKFFDGYQAPDRAALTKALGGLAAEAANLTGKALLKLSKETGIWVFGMDNTPMKTGERLIANPTISSGYIAWYMGKIEGEIMQPVSAGPVDPTRLTPVNSGSIPPGKKVPSGRGWEPQVSIDLVSRDEVPLNLVYKASSMGGRRALLQLAGAIAVGLQEDARRVYPVVELGVDSYTHSEYGNVYIPMLTIVEWLDGQGNVLPDLVAIAGKNNSLI